MFEGKHPGDPAAHLRAVSWSDLVAKFDAAREFRAALGMGEMAEEASFDPDSARHIAEIGDGKPAINLDDLANDKAAGGMGRTTKNGAASDDPRI